jgi:hypothetical protein
MIPLQPDTLDLTVVIPSMNEALNLEQLLRACARPWTSSASRTKSS